MYGQNRYLQHPYFTHGEELLTLDRVVWHVRRYCQYLRGTIEKDKNTTVDLLPLHLKRLQSRATFEDPQRFGIIGGYLERVLKEKGSELRAHLVWKNLYFGAAKRRTIGPYNFRSVSVNAIPFMEPEVFAVLRSRVDFPKAVHQYFDALTAQGRRNSRRPERRRHPPHLRDHQR